MGFLALLASTANCLCLPLSLSAGKSHASPRSWGALRAARGALLATPIMQHKSLSVALAKVHRVGRGGGREGKGEEDFLARAVAVPLVHLLPPQVGGQI